MKNLLNLVYILRKFIKVLYMKNIETHHINNLYIQFMIKEK